MRHLLLAFPFQACMYTTSGILFFFTSGTPSSKYCCTPLRIHSSKAVITNWKWNGKIIFMSSTWAIGISHDIPKNMVTMANTTPDEASPSFWPISRETSQQVHRMNNERVLTTTNTLLTRTEQIFLWAGDWVNESSSRGTLICFHPYLVDAVLQQTGKHGRQYADLQADAQNDDVLRSCKVSIDEESIPISVDYLPSGQEKSRQAGFASINR